ncbi:phosphate phosphate translocator, partial [Musa troglodytarum]
LDTFFCFFIICGNASLWFLLVSFNQAIGVTTLFFMAIFALMITCYHKPTAIFIALLPIILSNILSSNSEPLFHPLGFLLWVNSTSDHALKSIVQGIFLIDYHIREVIY